jgi:hypothetical protein
VSRLAFAMTLANSAWIFTRCPTYAYPGIYLDGKTRISIVK